ncbi:MAG TPA: DUF302 domain-containing protein [Gemmatimonadaceae bacterium]|jgi:uncharacterized protein (DUF302 family)
MLQQTTRCGFRTLSAELDIGLLLPCKVVVYQGDEPGQSVVAAMDR